jgi:hypothetical protein
VDGGSVRGSWSPEPPAGRRSGHRAGSGRRLGGRGETHCGAEEEEAGTMTVGAPTAEEGEQCGASWLDDDDGEGEAGMLARPSQFPVCRVGGGARPEEATSPLPGGGAHPPSRPRSQQLPAESGRRGANGHDLHGGSPAGSQRHEKRRGREEEGRRRGGRRTSVWR